MKSTGRDKVVFGRKLPWLNGIMVWLGLIIVSQAGNLWMASPALAQTTPPAAPASNAAPSPAATPFSVVNGPLGTREIALSEIYGQPYMQLSGLFDRSNAWLNVPTNWSLTPNSYMVVNVSHSALLLPQSSSLTLMLNNRPIASLRLDNTNLQNYNWRVPFPADFQPDKGLIQFSFVGLMRVNQLDCPPGDDKSSWVTISTSSKISLEYVAQAPATLADLTQTMFSGKAMTDRRVTVVLPANPSPRDMARAGQLIARLGSMAGYDSLDATLAYGAVPANASGTTRILLGGPTLFPALASYKMPLPLSGQSFSQNGQAIAPNVGVVQLASAGPTDPGAILVLSGGSDEGVDRALNAALDNTTLSLMRGSYSLIEPTSQYTPATNPNFNPTNLIGNGRNTFAGMGLDTQTVYGLGTLDINYNFTVPAYNTVTGNGQLSLNYSFAGVVDDRRSSMTVILNDVWLQSVPLVAANPPSQTQPITSPSQGELNPYRLNLVLPREALRSDSNRLTLRFGMYVPSPCGETPDYSDSWAAVYRTSELTVPIAASNDKSPGLANLPFPFTGEGNPALIVLPDAPKPADLRMAAHLAAELGRYEPDGQYSRIVLANVKQVTPDQLNQPNVIILGTPNTNSLAKEVNDKLPVAWNSSTARTLTTKWGLRFATNDAGLAALIEVAPSPWNAQRTALAIMSEPTDKDTGDQLISAFGRLQVGRYQGSILAVDTKGKTYSFSPQDIKIEPTPTAIPAPTNGATAPAQAAVPGQATPAPTITPGGGGASGATAPASASLQAQANSTAPASLQAQANSTVPASLQANTNSASAPAATTTTTQTSSNSGGISPLVLIILALVVVVVVSLGYWLFFRRSPTQPQAPGSGEG